MEKYMKFPMYKKETKDNGYHNDPFRAVNFHVDADGDLVCPGGKKFHFAYRKAVGRREQAEPMWWFGLGGWRKKTRDRRYTTDVGCQSNGW